MAVLKDIPGLGTQWSFKFFTEVDTLSLRRSLEECIREFERLYSRFKSSSLLSKLNREQRLLNPPEDLVRMCRLGQEYYALSGGLFNIATETHQRAQGYDAEYSFRERADLVPKTFDLSRSLRVSLDEITLEAGVTLDLGGLGKGYLIDKLSRYLQQERGLPYFVINGGGDIYVTSDHEQSVDLYLRHPLDSTKALRKVALCNQSLCASSPYVRRWGENTHLLDPFQPKRQITQSSFVIASSATEADILATVATLVTPEEFARLTRHLAVEYLII